MIKRYVYQCMNCERRTVIAPPAKELVCPHCKSSQNWRRICEADLKPGKFELSRTHNDNFELEKNFRPIRLDKVKEYAKQVTEKYDKVQTIEKKIETIKSLREQGNKGAMFIGKERFEFKDEDDLLTVLETLTNKWWGERRKLLVEIENIFIKSEE